MGLYLDKLEKVRLAFSQRGKILDELDTLKRVAKPQIEDGLPYKGYGRLLSNCLKEIDTEIRDLLEE